MIELFVDFGDLLAPALAVAVAEGSDLIRGPVEIIADKGDLLINSVSRIYGYIPASRKFTGISIFCPQWGHTDSYTGASMVLIRE